MTEQRRRSSLFRRRSSGFSNSSLLSDQQYLPGSLVNSASSLASIPEEPPELGESPARGVSSRSTLQKSQSSGNTVVNGTLAHAYYLVFVDRWSSQILLRCSDWIWLQVRTPYTASAQLYSFKTTTLVSDVIKHICRASAALVVSCTCGVALFRCGACPCEKILYAV